MKQIAPIITFRLFPMLPRTRHIRRIYASHFYQVRLKQQKLKQMGRKKEGNVVTIKSHRKKSLILRHTRCLSRGAASSVCERRCFVLSAGATDGIVWLMMTVIRWPTLLHLGRKISDQISIQSSKLSKICCGATVNKRYIVLVAYIIKVHAYTLALQSVFRGTAIIITRFKTYKKMEPG